MKTVCTKSISKREDESEEEEVVHVPGTVNNFICYIIILRRIAPLMDKHLSTTD